MKKLKYTLDGAPCSVMKIEVVVTQTEIIYGLCGAMWFYGDGEDKDWKPNRENTFRYLREQIGKFGVSDYISDDTIDEYKKEAAELAKILFPEYFIEEDKSENA